jgi:hypothetical protein
MPRKRPLASLRAQLAEIPPNVAALKWDPATGAFEATFFPPRPEPVAALAREVVPDPDEPPDGDFRFALERLQSANFPQQRRGVKLPPRGEDA